MITRIQELCRSLKPVLGKKVDRLWSVYLSESDPAGKADIEQTLELLAAKHLGTNYEPDRSPFPPPARKFANSGDIQLIKDLTTCTASKEKNVQLFGVTYQD